MTYQGHWRSVYISIFFSTMGKNMKVVQHQKLSVQSFLLINICLIICSPNHQRHVISFFFLNNNWFFAYEHDYKKCSLSKTKFKKVCTVRICLISSMTNKIHVTSAEISLADSFLTQVWIRFILPDHVSQKEMIYCTRAWTQNFLSIINYRLKKLYCLFLLQHN